MDYEELLTKQNYSCAICGSSNPKSGFLMAAGKKRIGYFRIDHDHKTNKLRGLLCNNCNLGLGNFKESVEVLQNALTYLKNGGLET
jgi:hypothetical protein